jgi:SNF2 family DNA or RNA helicase
MKVNTPLWSHQRAALDKFRGSFNYLLAGCATGKTLTMLKLIEERGYQRVLVITKLAAIRSAWMKDIEQHTTGIRAVPLLKGNSAAKALEMHTALYPYVERPTAVIVNYETARLIAKTIKECDFDLIIADECHKLKAYNSAVSLDLADACSTAKHRIAMTGTGFHDRPTDLYGQIRWLDPILKKRPAYHQSTVFGKYQEFFERYATYYERDNIKIATGYKNLEELTAKIEPFTFQIKTEDAVDLPAERHVEIRLEMPAEYRRVYTELRDEMLVKIEENEMSAPSLLTEMLRLHQLTGGFYQPDDMPGIVMMKQKSPKLDACLELLDEIGDQPVVIFTRFKHDVAILSSAIQDRKVMQLTGTYHDEYAFQYECTGNEVLIANIAAGAEGVNLSRAGYVIFYSTGFSNTEYFQATYRVRRPGRDVNVPVVYYHLMLDKSVDTVIWSTLQNKQVLTDQMMRGLVHAL